MNNFRDLLHNIEQFNLCIFEAPEIDEKTVEQKKVFKEITVNIFPNLMVETEFRDIGPEDCRTACLYCWKEKTKTVNLEFYTHQQ